MNDEIAERVRRLMITEHATNTSFSKKTGISRDIVSGLKSGKRNFGLKSLIRISEAYKVSLDWLVFGKGVKYF